MAQETETYVAVVAVDELRAGFLSKHEVEGREVVIATTDDGIHVYDATCPHSDFQFGPARLKRGCEVECPMHGARFRADAEGGVLKGPAKDPLDVLTSRVIDGKVEVLVDWLLF